MVVIPGARLSDPKATGSEPRARLSHAGFVQEKGLLRVNLY